MITDFNDVTLYLYVSGWKLVCLECVVQDIIAVGYGTFKAEEDGIGLICCWSIKNPEVSVIYTEVSTCTHVYLV